MPFGVDMNNGNLMPSQKKVNGLVRKIKRIVARYGLDDEEWAQAISSQYFLLCLAKQLKWKKRDYENLLNKCLSSFNVTYRGDYVLDDKKLLITPDETNRIMQCMQDEDDNDDYYTHAAKMQARNIDSRRMYLNFHYGLLIRIVSSEDTEVFRAIKHSCLNQLMSKNSLDTSDGWYPYRVPWITARILISLRAIDYSSYSNEQQVEEVVQSAISSLYQRLDEKAPYWRSGVGKWVTKWESTGLCLEALFVWRSVDEHKTEIRRILEYLCSEENKNEWLNIQVNFLTEEDANNTLAAVILASVILQISNEYFEDIYKNLYNDILDFFDKVIAAINNQAVAQVRQYCTVPQILHYVLAAIGINTEEKR